MIITLSVLIAIIISSAARAEEDASAGDEPASTATATTEPELVLLGRLVCMPCLMDERENAEALCELLEHGHQVLIQEAQDLEGHPLPGLKGELLDYRQPFDSQGVVLGEAHHGRRILVYGAIQGGTLRVDRVRPVRDNEPGAHDHAG